MAIGDAFPFISLWRNGAAAEPTLRGNGAFDYAVASETRFQPALLEIAGGRISAGSARLQYTARLVPEPENRNDGDAVRIEIEDQTVAYIRYLHAGRYQLVMHNHGLSGRPMRCQASIARGGARGSKVESLVVRLDLAWPPRIRSFP